MTGAARLLAPDLRPTRRLGQRVRAVDEHQRSAGHTKVTPIFEHRQPGAHDRQRILGSVALPGKHLVFAPVPTPRPVLVRPADAEWKVGLSRSQNLVQRSFQEALAGEPVPVVAEPMEPVLAGERRLLDARLSDAKVIETKIGWEMRLVMSPEKRPGARDRTPLGEALAPPRVVLRSGMELGQVERDGTHIRRHQGRASIRNTSLTCTTAPMPMPPTRAGRHARMSHSCDASTPGHQDRSARSAASRTSVTASVPSTRRYFGGRASPPDAHFA